MDGLVFYLEAVRMFDSVFNEKMLFLSCFDFFFGVLDTKDPVAEKLERIRGAISEVWYALDTLDLKSSIDKGLANIACEKMKPFILLKDNEKEALGSVLDSVNRSVASLRSRKRSGTPEANTGQAKVYRSSTSLEDRGFPSKASDAL